MKDSIATPEMTEFWLTVLTFAQTVTVQVGRQLLADFGQVQATEKADGSLVTQSDHWADQQLRSAIATTFPEHGVLSEEAEHVFPATDWCWVIDPLDGTTNFTRGIPIWGISLGLLYRGTPVFGYVHLPPLAQSFHGFWSAPGQPDGAFLNQKPIRTSTDSLDSNQFFSVCSRSISTLQNSFPCKIRLLGAASYNFLMVAAGATLGELRPLQKFGIWQQPGQFFKQRGSVDLVDLKASIPAPSWRELRRSLSTHFDCQPGRTCTNFSTTGAIIKAMTAIQSFVLT